MIVPKSSYEELIASAQGKLYVSDMDGAKKDLEAAVAIADGKRFKEILKLYTIVSAFFGEEVSGVICKKLSEKFPEYELALKESQ